MSHRSLLSAALLTLCVACGSPGGDDTQVDPDLDSDGDSITDRDEGAVVPVDTDGDGVPDYQDPDTDGDGIDDYREAGDADPLTPPVDSDRDGLPDFRDPDSDNNGLADGVDEAGDFDSDGIPDFQDQDDDGDGILDATEIGDPAHPVDTDGDGLPDFHDEDSDADGLADVDEGRGDSDGDGVPDAIDPRNDGPPPTLVFTAISTAFNSPIGIDYHEPTSSVVMSVNYPNGNPLNLERVELDGTHVSFSNFRAQTDEVKIATVRSGGIGGFTPGDLFVGNGVDGEIARVSADGATVTNPWVSLPGNGNGLMRGGMYVDRTGVLGGDLIVVTDAGQLWRVTSGAAPTQLATTGVHLEGMIVVPPYPARFGPLAGKIIAGAEQQGLMYVFSPDGTFTTINLGVAIEDIDLVTPEENFFGVNFGTSRLLGVPRETWRPITCDIVLTTETVAGGTTGLFRVYWNGTTLTAQPLPLGAGSATVGQWEHVTFAAAGIVEIP
jgi:hypothetical protein